MTQRTTVDPARHEGAESGAKGDPTGIDFEELMEIRARKNPAGFLAAVWKAFAGTAAPKEKPRVVELSDDENAHRIMSNAALAALAESVERLIGKIPDRVEVAPSDRIAVGQTLVDTGNPSKLLLSRQPDRLRVTIRNDDAANSIFIGTDPGLTTATGFEIIAGGERTIETRAALYAVAETASVVVSLLVEFGDLK